MKTKLLIAVLAVIGLAIAGYALRSSDTTIEYATILGTPGNHTPDARLPDLALQIEFDQANNRIISAQHNGEIIAWDISSGSRTELAKTTTGLFAYCRARQLLLVHEQEGIILHDLQDSKRQLVIEGVYHHAAWNRDCSTFTIANDAINKALLWRMSDLSHHIVLYTAEPARNGLAMSAKGDIVAVAGGTHDDIAGHKTQLDIFAFADNDKYSRSSPKDDGSSILGMWKMAFTPDGQSLIVPSQAKSQSGLRSLVADTAGQRWRKEGFPSYWIRAVATSPDSKQVATGDEKGWLRFWRTRNGAQVLERQTGQVIQSVSYSDDGVRLAVALWDSTIGIVDLSEF